MTEFGEPGRLGAALEVPRDLLLRRYPPFVTGGPLPQGDIPVFVFHSLEPEAFGRKAEYLAANGYQALSAAEYLAIIAGGEPAPPKAVVLTFDDGRRSVLTDGLPIMKRFGLKGIVFLVPGRTPQSDARGTNRIDGFLAWNDVATLVESGLFDIESHSLTHARIHTSGRVVATLQPAMQLGYDAMDVPLIRLNGRDLLAAEVPAGTPLLESAPRLGEARRFLEDEAARTSAAVGATLPGRFETDDERRAAIRRELAESKSVIEQHTGRPVRHLCYPWHLSGPTAEALAIEAGYETAFCGKVPGTAITRAGGDPRRIARIGEDYVELLPGKGRRSLTTILRRKWTRRFGRR